ncbi:MAG: carbohydrate-binding family 9-like protein [Gemmatimonadetes bacterium]|nr:carbohydrate-binding family 9-like protein [Gemmatimonadota bacterium]MBT7861367.1 carbohydrate-binding family 9-like protein [Gemmatimonadota bacterium]
MIPRFAIRAAILSCVLAICSGLPAVADELDEEYLLSIEPKHYVAQRALGPIEMDGRLDEPSWQGAAWTEIFVDIEGDRQPAPRFRTRAKMLWDDQYYYVAAMIDEPHIWATLDYRDAIIFYDNDFEVFIDPDGDTHNYFEYEVNALATEWDLLLVKPYRDGGPPYHGWDIPGLRSATTIYGTMNEPDDIDEGWGLEVAFPWEGLKQGAGRPVPPKPGDVWRVNFSRVEWEVDPAQDGEGYVKVEGRREDNWVWSPQGLINMHFPEQWGFVQFSGTRAGEASEAFAKPKEEEGKHLLREIYYRQLEFHAEHGVYSGSLDSLGVDHRILEHFLWPPILQATGYGYEAWVEEVVDLHEDGQISRWVMEDDSRIRKVQDLRP